MLLAKFTDAVSQPHGQAVDHSGAAVGDFKQLRKVVQACWLRHDVDCILSFGRLDEASEEHARVQALAPIRQRHQLYGIVQLVEVLLTC